MSLNKINKDNIFRIIILILLTAFLIFLIVKLITKNEKDVPEKDKEYFVNLISEYRLDSLDIVNTSITDMNKLDNNFKLKYALDNLDLESNNTSDAVLQYLHKIFGQTMTVEAKEVIGENEKIIYKYENEKFNKVDDYKVDKPIESKYLNVVDFNYNNNEYELTITKIFYNVVDGNIKNGFFGSYASALNSKNNEYNTDGALFTLELTDNIDNNLELLDKYYNENKDSISEKLTKYKYTFKKENDNCILIKYEILD